MLSSHDTPQSPRVVLVEDDEMLQSLLARALERALPEVELQSTADPEEALHLARDHRSRLLITEAQSVSVDGVTLAACVRQQRPLLPLIFLADAPGSFPAARIGGFDGFHLIDKPPQIEQFVGLVTRVLHHAPGFRGEVSATGLIDLVQLVATTTPTAALHLESPGGRGTVWFEDGAIVHAAFGRECGAPAFHDMLRLASGSFSIEAMANAPEHTISSSITGFLLESMCALDEECASGVRTRTASAADYFENGLQAVRDKRYGIALAEWEQAAALEPTNRIYQHNLMRLRRMIQADHEQQQHSRRR
jgi:CheY-like chemotaxis protein